MKTKTRLALAASLLILMTASHASGSDPQTVFQKSPESAKPGVLWMGSNLSREGITRDLETLKAARRQNLNPAVLDRLPSKPNTLKHHHQLP